MSSTIFDVLRTPDSIIGFVICTTVGVYGSRGLPWFPRLLHISLAASFFPFGEMAAHYHSGLKSNVWFAGAITCALIVMGIRWRYYALLAAQPHFTWQRDWPTPWGSRTDVPGDQHRGSDENKNGNQDKR